MLYNDANKDDNKDNNNDDSKNNNNDSKNQYNNNNNNNDRSQTFFCQTRVCENQNLIFKDRLNRPGNMLTP